MPRVLVVADAPGWAWERKGNAYKHWLDGFDVEVAFQTQGLPPFLEFDLVHCFEFPQTRFVPDDYRARGGKVVTGVTANVWRTWGVDQVRAWGLRADGIHANSYSLFREVSDEIFRHRADPPVFYCPNGVEVDDWTRATPHPSSLVAGHVGKPNLRKGAPIIIEACRRTDVPVKIIQRTAKLAYGAPAMRIFYEGVSLQLTASNMDGTPNPMLESACYENALLSTPIGNMPDLIEAGVNGFLLPPLVAPLQATPTYSSQQQIEENKELIDAFVEHLDWMKWHYAKVLEMGREARRSIVKDWTWEHQSRHVAGMWRTVLGGGA